MLLVLLTGGIHPRQGTNKSVFPPYCGVIGCFLDFPCLTVMSTKIKLTLLKGLGNPEERGRL